MHETLILASGFVIIAAAWRVLMKTRDPLAPMVIFSPMLLYMFVYNPWIRYRSGNLMMFFRDLEELELVFYVLFAGVTSFCFGLSWGRVRRNAPDRRFELLPQGLPVRIRGKLFRLAILLGVIANTAHFYMISYSGGWTRVFSQAKPFLRTPSGYIGELPMLVYPAILLLAIALQGKRLTPPRIALFLLISIPQITMATFGGRRGPMFLIVCALGACWCIVNSRRPKLKTILLGGGCLAIVLFLLGGNRSRLFRPWENEIDFTVVSDRLGTTAEVTTGEEFIAGSAMIIASEKLDRHFWGLRYFTTFAVRPIPSLIWPTKYEDMGMGWMRTAPGSSGISDSEWLSTFGFIPAGGNAGGFIPDLFLEFSWGCVIFCFLIGRFYSGCWIKWRTQGGIWVLLYFELLILSIYLPSQSVGAWLYRLMLLVIPTIIIWKKIIAPNTRPAYQVRRVPQAPLRATR